MQKTVRKVAAFVLVFLTGGALLGLAPAAQADEVTPGLLYNMGGKFDKSFNEAAYNGAESFKAESGGSGHRVRTPCGFRISRTSPPGRASPTWPS